MCLTLNALTGLVMTLGFVTGQIEGENQEGTAARVEHVWVSVCVPAGICGEKNSTLSDTNH